MTETVHIIKSLAELIAVPRSVRPNMFASLASLADSLEDQAIPAELLKAFYYVANDPTNTLTKEA